MCRDLLTEAACPRGDLLGCRRGEGGRGGDLLVEAGAVHRLRREAQGEGAVAARVEVRQRDEPRARRRLLRRRPRVHRPSPAPRPRRRRRRLALPRRAAVEGGPVVVLLRRARLLLRGLLRVARVRLLREERLDRDVRVVAPPRRRARHGGRGDAGDLREGPDAVGGGRRVGIVAFDGADSDEPDGALDDAEAHEEGQDAVLRAPVDLVANHLRARAREEGRAAEQAP